MRDLLKSKNYYEGFIEKKESIYSKRQRKISENLIPESRIEIVKADMSKNILYKCIAKFSAGFNIEDLLKDFYECINLTNEGWKKEGSLKFREKDKIYDQYTISAYNQMLIMLSLGYLLNIPNDKFQILVNVIDRDNVKDNLFEFIISAKLKNRSIVESESYYKYFFVPEFFKTLREVIKTVDKEKCVGLIKRYLESEWYNIQSETGIKNLHNNIHDLYYGYWSFEVAAVVKIMGLDDSSFIDHKYYPKDLVHQVKEESKKKKGFWGKLGI